MILVTGGSGEGGFGVKREEVLVLSTVYLARGGANHKEAGTKINAVLGLATWRDA